MDGFAKILIQDTQVQNIICLWLIYTTRVCQLVKSIWCTPFPLSNSFASSSPWDAKALKDVHHYCKWQRVVNFGFCPNKMQIWVVLCYHLANWKKKRKKEKKRSFHEI
jgi:hypothetical protein